MNDHVYYVVDGVKTLSRNEALIKAGGDLSRVKFVCMDSVWDQQQWATESEESFDSMCEKRCWQLRLKYDWICVWTSGGYDSQTVLDSFIRSGAKIDEIAYMDRLDYYDDPEVPFIIKNALDYQKYHNPQLKITPIKVNFDYTKNFYQQNSQDWILLPGVSYRFSKSTASYVHRFNHQLLDSKNSTRGSRADIYGKEKPTLDLRDGHWYMNLIDLAYTDTMGPALEFFFVSPDMPELHVKQCHMAIRWFESLPDLTHDLVHRIQSHVAEYYQSWNLGLGRKQTRCPESVDALTKRYFLQSKKSFESKKMLDHVMVEKDQSYSRYIDNVDSLKKIVGSSISQAITTKEWAIRPKIQCGQPVDQ